MDGSMLLRAIREHAEYKEIPFMLMCALPESSLGDRVQGYDAFLRKPFKLAEMSGRVTDLLNRPAPANE
jgi:DNA-binding response OmpR family regulator